MVKRFRCFREIHETIKTNLLFFSLYRYMGVKDLNKLARNFPIILNGNYKYVLIDASNLFITYLFRYYALLPSRSSVDINGCDVSVCDGGRLLPYDVNVQKQFFITNILKDITNMIDVLTKKNEGLNKIYFITDPPEEYKYRYIKNQYKQMSRIDTDMFNTWTSLNNKTTFDENENIELIFSSKEDERKLRVISQSKTHDIMIIKPNGDITMYEDYVIFDELRKKGNPNDKFLYECLYQFTYYINRNNLLSLLRDVQIEFVEMIETNENVEYLQACSEADIFIKSFYDKYLKDENRTLIISNDTDYMILLGEYENVDILSVSEFSKMKPKNPFSYWCELFGVSDMLMLRMLLCRLSALFGNDYTIHNRKITCNTEWIETNSNIQKLFNLNKFTYNQIEVSKRTSLYKLIYNMETNKNKIKQEENNNFKLLDYTISNNIKTEKDKRFFNGYFETLLIYLNFDIYCDFKRLNKTYFETIEKNQPIQTMKLIDDDEIVEYDCKNIECNLIESITGMIP